MYIHPNQHTPLSIIFSQKINLRALWPPHHSDTSILKLAFPIRIEGSRGLWHSPQQELLSHDLFSAFSSFRGSSGVTLRSHPHTPGRWKAASPCSGQTQHCVTAQAVPSRAYPASPARDSWLTQSTGSLCGLARTPHSSFCLFLNSKSRVFVTVPPLCA